MTASIEAVAHDVSPEPVQQNRGRVFLVPSSSEAGDMTRVLQEGYDVRLLKKGFRELIKALELDYIFVDTHPGLTFPVPADPEFWLLSSDPISSLWHSYETILRQYRI